MSESGLLAYRLGAALGRLARPHRLDEALPADVQANLWQLGVPCNDLTPREDVIARLWAMKRQLAPVPAFSSVNQDWQPPAA